MFSCHRLRASGLLPLCCLVEPTRGVVFGLLWTVLFCLPWWTVGVPCGLFLVLFQQCSMSTSSSDQHCCKKNPETQLDLPWSPSLFLFVTRIPSIGTNLSQSIRASLVFNSHPRHSSQPVTLLSLSLSHSHSS